MLLRRSALERIGGLSAIRSEVIDDCALARAVKRSGGTIWMGLTRSSRSLRSYTTFSEIRDMIARTAFTQLHYSTLLLLLTLVGMFLTFLAPVILTFSAEYSRVAVRISRVVSNDRFVSPNGDLLPPAPLLGATPAIRRDFLYLFDLTLCNALLARPRRPMERPRTSQTLCWAYERTALRDIQLQFLLISRFGTGLHLASRERHRRPP